VAIVSRQRREEPQNPDARRKHTWKVNQERREPYMLTTKIIWPGSNIARSRSLRNRTRRHHRVVSHIAEIKVVVQVGSATSLGVGLVHQRDLTRNSGPLELAAERFVASLTLKLLPFEQLVGEAKMRLDNNVQAPGSDKAATIVSMCV
jgi:hypothetical protein